MAETQRKIELQSPEDLRHLINNAKRAASEKIDRAFPPMANQGEDAMKMRVQELVDEYITQTFTNASPNITINGYPANLSDASKNDPILEIEEYEPLNGKLQQRALDLARKEEDLLIEIAGLRREAPVKAVGIWRDGFREGVEGDEGVIGRVEEEVKRRKGEVGVGVGVGVGVEMDVEEAWKRGVDELGRLRDGLPGTAGKLEKARGVGEFVKGGV